MRVVTAQLVLLVQLATFARQSGSLKLHGSMLDMIQERLREIITKLSNFCPDEGQISGAQVIPLLPRVAAASRRPVKKR